MRRPGDWIAPPPPRVLPWALAALGLALAAMLAGFAACRALFGLAAGGIAVALVAAGLGGPLVASLMRVPQVRRLGGDLPTARAVAAAARGRAQVAVGRAAAVLVVAGLLAFAAANDGAVAATFLGADLFGPPMALIARAFLINIAIFLVAQALVLVWGLAVALARLAPGSAGRPLRALATAYVDVFRALPGIVTIYLVGFGLPMTDLPPFATLPPMALAILALTLTYGAYVAEVYRAGLEGVPPSQWAAALSLGLTPVQALRHIILPQAVRRVVPALLNDFISLQKDTALVSVIGVIDAFNQSKIIAANHFTLAAVTGVAVLFIAITIPQTRLADRLMAADQRRRGAGGAA